MSKRKFLLVLLLIAMTFLVIYITNNDEEVIYYEPLSEFVVDEKEDKDESPSEIISNLQKKYKNKDIKAQLRFSNANYRTPVPQSINNEYYLRRLPDKSHGLNGSTFLDYRTKLDKSRVLIIYGHNSSKYNMPFRILENYYNKEYYEKNKYIELVTSNGIKTYEIFSVYVESKDFSYYTDVEFKNDNEFLNHINKLKSKSFYDTGVSLDKNDNILILQACSTHKKYQKNKYKFVLIISKEVIINENDKENN